MDPPTKSLKLRFKVKKQSMEEDTIDNGETLHPLNIDHVLNKIISYLDLDDLKSASLVCSRWCSEVRKILVKNTLVISLSHSTAKGFKDYEAVDSYKIESLKNIMQRSPIHLRLKFCSCTVSKLRIPMTPCDNDGPGSMADIVETLVCQFLGNHIEIRHLDLRFCDRYIKHVWRLICSAAHHLRSLNVESEMIFWRQDDEVEEEDYQCNFDDEISFPNLKILSGHCNQIIRASGGVTMSKMFKKIMFNSSTLEGLHWQLSSSENELLELLSEKPTVLNGLKDLSRISLNVDEMTALRRKKLNLGSLSFRIHGGFHAPEVMNPLLSDLGKSLKSLEIDYQSFSRIPDPFACGIDLVNLNHLSLKKFFGSIHFVMYMPHLKSVRLEDINLSVALHDESSRFDYVSGLESLKIYGGRGSTGRFLFPAVYSDIVKFFPKLKTLRMEYFTDSTLKIIVGGLSELEELDIPNGIYSDLLIAEENHHGSANHSDGNEGNSKVKSESILDLKHLRKLVLQSPKITDAGISQLIYSRELRSLSIDTPMMSKKGLEVICSSPYIRHLELRNCYQLTSKCIEKSAEMWREEGRKLVALGDENEI